jgi:para-nitrobenzyl esterase
MRGRIVNSIAGRALALVLVASICAVLAVAAAGCGASTVASTDLGKVQGQATANGTLAFLGIPYAAPPVGNLRFMPPRPASPWSGTRKAYSPGKSEAQPPDAISGTSVAQQSEDCLTLNVWSPALDNSRRPVMVWIHGGGFTNGTGSDPLYDGAKLSKRGNVTVVTINYRLGPFGFLYLGGVGGPDYAQSGNLGLLDQVAAIRWVRDNIASFGGDPGNITVFGESAGSMSISTLLGMPSAKGLFRRAIADSGAANLMHSTQNAAAITARFMQLAGVSDIAGLRSLTTAQMVQAETAMATQKTSYELLFGPVVDGSAVPQPPLDAITAGSASGVDLLIGTNLDEMRLWTLAVPALAQFPLGVVSGFIPIVQQAITLTSLGTPDAVAASYQSRRPQATPPDVSLAVLTDSMFRVPAIRVAEAQSARQSRTWMYLFTWPSPTVPTLGACHAIELPFVFGNLEGGRIARLIGSTPPQNLSETMQDAWTAFARTGDPNAAGVPHWQPYESRSRATMILNTSTQQQDDPYGADRQVWDGIPFDGVKPSL